MARTSPLRVPLRSFRFVMPGFLFGAARVVDLQGALNTYLMFRDQNETDAEFDARAIASDFEAVGAHMKSAIAAVGAEAGVSPKDLRKLVIDPTAEGAGPIPEA